MNKKVNKPNFFIVGHMKTGTTALYHYFNDHPQVYVPEFKEMSYFAREFVEKRWKHKGDRFLKHFIRDLDHYLSMYKDSQDEDILLDVSPSYLFSKKAAKRIYKFNPNAKVLIILREPVGFMRSLHSGMVFDLIETENDFVNALALEETRIKENSHEFLHYKKWTHYEKLILRFINVFPNEQIMIAFYEEIKNSNDKFLKDLSTFLGMDFIPNLEFKTINANKKLVFGGIIKKIGRAPIIYDFVRSFIPRDVYWKLFKVYSSLVYKNTPRDELPNSVITKLKKEQFDNVNNLEKYLKTERFIKKDYSLLKLWGYDKINN